MKRQKEISNCVSCGNRFESWASKNFILCEACEIVTVSGVTFQKSRTAGYTCFHDLLASESFCKRNKIKNPSLVGYTSDAGQIAAWGLYAIHTGDWSWWLPFGATVMALQTAIVESDLQWNRAKLSRAMDNRVLSQSLKAEIYEKRSAGYGKLDRLLKLVAITPNLKPLMSRDVQTICMVGAACKAELPINEYLVMACNKRNEDILAIKFPLFSYEKGEM